ncbi:MULTISPECIES: acetyl-CoA carboxylase biotin carboxylase subunit family protein [unclassified Mesorhizobium]|uniref:ATP-grasp domain-containing protein n=1 Tax=unclassified Mesorhizobium TaxID=325217 RepID=UPI0004CF2FB7|nr:MULTISPECIES: acetyl-CoA carboxylase biotin carboxylase subunit family protein [unclassified Mesorhizobium]WJI84374.1 acetyl-CoA carboxylase biotin carboxylase subunit family protein [Mesorhizobium sp. C374B]WJI90170.1 acetyl-CoA carboxylase biotin carboxylase subunit family protein [Mesorhizobium sp. C372A]
MARRALILVEGHPDYGLRYIQAAQRLGIHSVTFSADPAQYDYLAAEAVEAIRVDTDDLDALIRECFRLRATYDIAGITGFSRADESAYATASRLCRYFHLPGPNPESIERCCDKFLQRHLLAEAGVPIPAYRLASNATQAASSAVDIGLPVILKPTVGSGSNGVRLCRNVDEVAEHTTYLLGEDYLWRPSPRILVEEFAQGPYYCAHFMQNEIIGISAADFGPPPHFVFRRGIFPAPLTDDDYRRIADVSLSCLRILNLGWGPTNIEFRWTRRGPVVIEVNPRLAGGAQSIHLAYDVDLITEHIKLVIGDEWNLHRRHSHIAAWRALLPDRDGILDWIDGDSRAAAVPGVAEVKFYIKPKTAIVRKGDYRDSMGYVIAASPSPAAAEMIVQRAVSFINWSIIPFPTVGG